MNAKILPVALLAWFAADKAQGQTYTNFVRQIQSTSGVQYDMTVGTSGSQTSPLAINPGGATFQLWTVQSSPLASSMLSTQYVGSYVPVASVVITSEDPYTIIPRTRCDRPFTVSVTTSGLLPAGTGVPTPATEVSFNHYTQSYGSGTGVGIDRTQATLASSAYITTDGTQAFSYGITTITGADRLKIRGEERFDVLSVADYQTPVAVLASQYVQIWPIADATITGLPAAGAARTFTLAPITITLNDLYPNSKTYAQVYKGAQCLGTVGTVVQGSAINIADSVPNSRTGSQALTISNWDKVADSDGTWTIEVLTITPFGTERLTYATFSVDRSITVHGNVNSMD
jgi:hypothetical protein